MEKVFYQGKKRIKTVDEAGEIPVFIDYRDTPYFILKGVYSSDEEWELFKTKGVK